MRADNRGARLRYVTSNPAANRTLMGSRTSSRHRVRRRLVPPPSAHPGLEALGLGAGLLRRNSRGLRVDLLVFGSHGFTTFVVKAIWDYDHGFTRLTHSSLGMSFE